VNTRMFLNTLSKFIIQLPVVGGHLGATALSFFLPAVNMA